jgi:RHS repeat-associated protein
MPTTNYIWDEENLLAEADGSNIVQTVYTNEPQQYGNLISNRISGTTSYHHFDALGSTRQLTNAAGTVTDTVNYDAWGNVVSRTGATGIAFLWIGEAGYFLDLETGTHAVRARPYSAPTSRWLTRDLRRRRATVNLYIYAINGPATFTDPSGMDVDWKRKQGLPQAPYYTMMERWYGLEDKLPSFQFEWNLRLEIARVPDGATQLWLLMDITQKLWGPPNNCWVPIEPHSFWGDVVAIDELTKLDQQPPWYLYRDTQGADTPRATFRWDYSVTVIVGFNDPDKPELNERKSKSFTEAEARRAKAPKVPLQFNYSYHYWNGNVGRNNCLIPGLFVGSCPDIVIETLDTPWVTATDEDGENTGKKPGLYTPSWF